MLWPSSEGLPVLAGCHFSANVLPSLKPEGKLILRFDDTNPTKEKLEFVENIMKELQKWLSGFEEVLHVGAGCFQL